MNYNFSHKLRLTTDAQFKQVFRKANKISTEICAVFYCYNNFSCSRLGVIAPKKSIKKANDRNYFKRAIREGFRLRQYELGAIDVVFLAYRGAENVGKEKLCQCLKNQWDELILRQKRL